MTERAIVWFRRDLRIRDNRALVEAATADELLPVYVFDPEKYGSAEFGGEHSFRYQKTGPFRAQFIREAVTDLRNELNELWCTLAVRTGDPATVLAELAEEYGITSVYAHTYPTPEEQEREERVRERLSEQGVAFERIWGHTLYHPEDLPMGMSEIPDTYTTFRKQVEANGVVQKPLKRPSIPPHPDIKPGEIPSLEALGLSQPPESERAAMTLSGGEQAGIDRLDEYIWKADALKEYKETRNGLLGKDYSSKLSPWLNQGCLSPRYVHAEVKRYESQRVANDSTYWLLFELLWRDFFQFQFAKHGAQFFDRGGIRRRTIAWRDDPDAFKRWKSGNTGIPFVDAGMRELNQTGYLSNRARQIVASFLANDLRIDWRKGAAYFETMLIDFDPAVNYGNWAYIAGVGNDSRDRKFDILAQADRYDPDGEYVAHWIPALKPLPPEKRHRPWELAETETNQDVTLATDYPKPLVDSFD